MPLQDFQYYDEDDYSPGLDEGDTDEALWELWWSRAQPQDVWCFRALCGDLQSDSSATPCAQDDPEAVWTMWYVGAQPPHVSNNGEEGDEGEGVYYDTTLCASSELHITGEGEEDASIGGIEGL